MEGAAVVESVDAATAAVEGAAWEWEVAAGTGKALSLGAKPACCVSVAGWTWIEGPAAAGSFCWINGEQGGC